MFSDKIGEFQKAPPGGAPWKEVPLDRLAFHFLYPKMLKATMAATSTNPNTTASPIAPALDAVALLDPEAAQTKNPRLKHNEHCVVTLLYWTPILDWYDSQLVKI
jgi:hypothetical protein